MVLPQPGGTGRNRVAIADLADQLPLGKRVA
jgi:hypothetical protein